MATDKDILVGVDVGTSGTRVVAFDLDGQALAVATREHELAMPRPGWAEQDPDEWWKATCSSLKAVTSKIDASRIGGVSFSGQMHGSVFLDSEGRVIRPALLWCDGRTAPQCEAIVERVGREKLLETTRNLPLTSFTLPKVLWLRENEPDNYRQLRTVLLPKDYVRYRMTGVKSMEESDGAGTLMMEVGKKRWAVDMLDTLDVDSGILPPLTHASDVVGRVTHQAARETGLPVDTLVVAGGGDQPVGAVGVGAFEEGRVMLSLGTSGVVLAPTRETHTADGDGLASFDHAVAGRSYLMGCMLSAGGALQWYRNTLCAAERADAKKRRVDAYDILLEGAAEAPIGCEGLVFLPYLMGERTPHNNPAARGAWVGLSGRHDKNAMTRALLEGVSFGLRDGLEAIKARKVAIKNVLATGGGARSRFWLQMLADVFGVPITPIENPEGPALGAAILAGVGTGGYRDFEEAAQRAIRTGQPAEPDRGHQEIYDRAYARFRAAYPALREWFSAGA
jgi:xylulokinase